ncbi:DDE-type integrase/transposase/recombinase [Fuchsiella alkaliacetigena]|nr:DDE-type integrase/transposase/recombinase [Fuchsiella alkaliacetigena]
MWHIDITYIPVKDDHAYLISVLDGYSRCIVSSKLSLTMTTNDVKDVVSKALFKADLYEVAEEQKPALISDNGTQLVSNDFKEFLSELDIKHIRTAVRHPESNGKIEVFHKTIKHENVYIKEKYSSFYEAKEDIANFIETYNHSRLHQGIEFVTPYDKYTRKADEIIFKIYLIFQKQCSLSRKIE